MRRLAPSFAVSQAVSRALPAIVLDVALVGCLAVLLAGCDGSSREDQAAKAPHPGGVVPVIAAKGATTTRAGAKHAAPAVDSSQPAVPPLPADVDLLTTDVELGAQALMVAQEEHDRGDLGGTPIADRHRYVYQVWRPQMLERQAMLQKILDDRRHEHDRQVAQARHVAELEAHNRAVEAKLTTQVEEERRRTAPILSPREREILGD